MMYDDVRPRRKPGMMVCLGAAFLAMGCGEVRPGADSGTGPGQPDAAGTCVPGSICSTGNPCEIGEVRCVEGAATCVSIAPAAAGVECRVAAGLCDLPETCDGVSTVCPADSFVATGTECMEGGESGTCNGLGPSCVLGCIHGSPCNTGNACELGQIDCSSGEPQCVATGVQPEGTECRPTAGPCDAAEICDGSSITCPADTFAPAASASG